MNLTYSSFHQELSALCILAETRLGGLHLDFFSFVFEIAGATDALAVLALFSSNFSASPLSCDPSQALFRSLHASQLPSTINLGQPHTKHPVCHVSGQRW